MPDEPEQADGQADDLGGQSRLALNQDLEPSHHALVSPAVCDVSLRVRKGNSKQ